GRGGSNRATRVRLGERSQGEPGGAGQGLAGRAIRTGSARRRTFDGPLVRMDAGVRGAQPATAGRAPAACYGGDGLAVANSLLGSSAAGSLPGTRRSLGGDH